MVGCFCFIQPVDFVGMDFVVECPCPKKYFRSFFKTIPSQFLHVDFMQYSAISGWTYGGPYFTGASGEVEAFGGFIDAGFGSDDGRHC